jgi:transcriptional regulator with XRE-family HTH domain
MGHATNETVGGKLRELRIEASRSIRSIARESGLPLGFLIEVELGRARASDRVLAAYAAATAVAPLKLFSLVGRLPPEVLAKLTEDPNALARALADNPQPEEAHPMASSEDPDLALLTEITESNDERLRDEEREAFVDMLDRLTSGRVEKLSPKQKAWLGRVAARLDLSGDDSHGSANLFSSLPKEEQERQREAARKNSPRFPWET